LLFDWRRRHKKTHDRFQPWVFVEIVFMIDKYRRPRRLRRLPAAILVELFLTSGRNVVNAPMLVKLYNKAAAKKHAFSTLRHGAKRLSTPNSSADAAI
jgi:hypothetical protein